MRNDEKIERLVALGWPRHIATAFVRAGGRCEYCGCDLLYDRLGYAVREMDHLLPQRHYPRLAEHPDNLIYSCRLCNGIKGDWDPALPGVELPEDHLQDHRDGLVMRARAHIYEARAIYDHEWIKVMKIKDS